MFLLSSPLGQANRCTTRVHRVSYHNLLNMYVDISYFVASLIDLLHIHAIPVPSGYCPSLSIVYHGVSTIVTYILPISLVLYGVLRSTTNEVSVFIPARTIPKTKIAWWRWYLNDRAYSCLNAAGGGGVRYYVLHRPTCLFPILGAFSLFHRSRKAAVLSIERTRSGRAPSIQTTPEKLCRDAV